MAERKRGPKAKDAAPTPLAGVPAPPRTLDAACREHWKKTARLIADAGLLSALDADALLLYVTLWGRWREARKELAKPEAKGGGVVITAPNGYRQRNPWADVEMACQKDLKYWADKLGLTPMARSKIKLPEPEEVDDKWADFDHESG